MLRESRLARHPLQAKACVVKRGIVTPVAAVDLKGSKSLALMSDDFGIVVYNGSGYGFAISWKEIDSLQELLNISQDNYDLFLDNLTEDLLETIIKQTNK